MLRRLLGRFLHFATTPDPRMGALARATEDDDAWVAAHYRIPNWTYWPSVLRFLHKHRDQVIEVAPNEVAQVAEMWLAHAPTDWPFRREAAEIGLALGERALRERERYRARRAGKLYYRAALAGARELPDQIAEFALRAAERVKRLPQPEDATAAPAPLPKSLVFHPRFDPDEPVPEPWPDGPLQRVDDDYREAVLDAAVLQPTIATQPAIAREIVLAVLIRARRRHEWNDHWSDRLQLKIERIHGWLPPLYIQGPFLTFLQCHFEEALELIARLVDFTTNQWIRRVEEESDQHETEDERSANDIEGTLARRMRESRRPAGSLTLNLGGEERLLLGDERVFGWSAGIGNPPGAVEVALMALEQFFYLKIQADEPVDEYAKSVLERARSVAFLGVLCDVGRRQPVLFEGPLLSLLGVAEIYSWEIRKRVQGRSHLMIGAPLKGELFVRLAQQFNEFEHRKQDLRDVALELFFNRPVVRSFLEGARQEWEAKVAAHPGDQLDVLEGLIIRFNVENWRVQQHPEHGHILTNVRAEELAVQRAEERKVFEDDQLVIYLPIHCRMLLDEGRGLSHDQLEAFWGQLQRISVLDEHCKGRYSPEQLANALCGGIAVLVRFHRGWLAEREDRQAWCLERLATITLMPQSVDPMDAAESVATWTWDCLAAEAIPPLWADEPSSKQLRRLVARLVFSHHYVAVQILLARCAEHRTILGSSFTQLRRLLFEWAFVRDRVEAVRYSGAFRDRPGQRVLRRFDRTVGKWLDDKVQAFVDGRLASGLGVWETMDDPTLFREIDKGLRARPRAKFDLDLRLVCDAHSWISTPDDARDASERAEWIEFWQQALRYILRPGSEYDRSYPDGSARWVLDGIAAAVPYLGPDERRDDLWRPILSLDEEADKWAEAFLESYHSLALQRDPVPAGYLPTLRLMFDHVIDGSVSSAAIWRLCYRDFWTALLGLDDSTSQRWEPRHKDVVAQIADLFERWLSHSRDEWSVVRAFARFLERPAAEPILLRGLLWLERAICDPGRSSNEHERWADAVGSLLNVVWTQHEARLRTDQEAFAAFRNLLRHLADRQHAVALELQGRIGALA